MEVVEEKSVRRCNVGGCQGEVRGCSERLCTSRSSASSDCATASAATMKKLSGMVLAWHLVRAGVGVGVGVGAGVGVGVGAWAGEGARARIWVLAWHEMAPKDMPGKMKKLFTCE